MITLDLKKQYVKYKLRTSQAWALRALALVYTHQTATEQQTEQTTEENGVGFTGVDAEFLSSLAKQHKQRGFLTPKQLVYLHKKISKYWRQVLEVCSAPALAQCMREDAGHCADIPLREILLREFCNPLQLAI